MKERVQPKLEVGPPNDKYEREADRVADTVMRMPDQRAQRRSVEEEKLQMQSLEQKVQMKCKKCEEKEKIQLKQAVQMKSDGKSNASPKIAGQLNASKGHGTPLPSQIQKEMSQKMGADFNNVRIHTDSHAVQMNQQLGARAFTYGHEIYFNKGEYAPESSQGKHLLAHELTHTIQQKNETINLLQRVCGRENDRTVPDFPETYIEHIDVDVTNPATVRFRWTGPNASDHGTGPFHATIGDGRGIHNCDDVEVSNKDGTNCTPKGDFTIVRQACSLGNHSQARNASYFQSDRGIAFHYWPKRPNCPASHGCVRLKMEVSEILWDNCINEGTSSSHGKPATTVRVTGTWSPCGTDEPPERSRRTPDETSGQGGPTDSY